MKGQHVGLMWDGSQSLCGAAPRRHDQGPRVGHLSPVEHGAVRLCLRLQLLASILANGPCIILCSKDRGEEKADRLTERQ